jgi:RNAse (barnase) inhibitor barstar
VTQPTFRIEGVAFNSLEGFYDEIERQLLGGDSFGRNLDALHDILGGDFAALPREFGLEWIDSALSRQRLGYAETARQLRLRLERCHHSNRAALRADLEAAERGEGPTVFDWLIDIIRSHGNVKLRLA